MRVWMMAMAALTLGAACGDGGTSPGADTSADTLQDAGHDTAPADSTPDSTPDSTTPDSATPTDTTAPDVSNGSGFISVTSTAILGRAGYVFIAFGPNHQTRYCVSITSESFVVPPGRLSLAESNPCGPATDDVLFPAGDHAVTAGIYLPGETTPIVLEPATATVDGDVTVTFDGAALSVKTGAPGKLFLTSTPITGQSGRLLLVLGTDTVARMCVSIDSDPFTLSATPMTELTGDPCSGVTAVTTFSGGEQGILAGIYVPGEQQARKLQSVIVVVDGDTTFELDGGALSE
ncbi:MAG: hypothetical protein U1F43_15565 [Myxococcota bacterium]